MKKLLKSQLVPEVLHLTQKISEFRGRWKAETDTQKDFYSSLRKTVIITSAGASTRIEGAKLSDEEILKKLSGLKIKKITDRDEAEVAGYIDSKKFIFSEYADLTISEHSIRALHQMMMAYLPESLFPLSQRGVYKNITNSVVKLDHESGEETVIFETWPPGPQTDAAMHELIQDYNGYISDPNYSDLEVIAAFIVKFLAIHPFRDGNGRISRLLTDLCLLKCGYDFCMYASQEKFIEDSKEQYYVSLRHTQATMKTNPDLNPWFIFFLKVLEKQVRCLRDKIQPRQPGHLTSLEEKVLALVQKHQPVTIGFLARESKIANSTLKAILARLKAREILAMEGQRKSSRYTLK